MSTVERNLINREEWLQSTLLEIPQGSRILDAGAGELKYKKFCNHLLYISQDFAQYNGKGDAMGLQTDSWDQTRLDIVSDITHIPEPDMSFDAVMCIEVLEHLPEPVEALRELTRLLKPGGWLIVTAPFCSLAHMTPFFYQTGYSRYFFEHWLEKLDYEILNLQFNGNYFDYLAQELLRLPTVVQEFTGKKMGRLSKLAKKLLFVALQRYSFADRGSNQLLCFGLHILARRRSQDKILR